MAVCVGFVGFSDRFETFFLQFDAFFGRTKKEKKVKVEKSLPDGWKMEEKEVRGLYGEAPLLKLLF